MLNREVINILAVTMSFPAIFEFILEVLFVQIVGAVGAVVGVLDAAPLGELRPPELALHARVPPLGSYSVVS